MVIDLKEKLKEKLETNAAELIDMIKKCSNSLDYFSMEQLKEFAIFSSNALCEVLEITFVNKSNDNNSA